MNNQKTNNASMSEQELLTDLLHSERDAVKQYASNCTESGCEDQLAVFEQMKQRNMYKTKPAKVQELQTAKQDMTSLQQQTW